MIWMVYFTLISVVFVLKKVSTFSAIEKKPLYHLFTINALEEIFVDCCDQEILSDTSLSSVYKLNVKSTEGAIRTSGERFYLREVFLEKCKLITKKFANADYYIDKINKYVHFSYNIPITEDTSPIMHKISNVFALQLFGLKEEHDFRRLHRFLATSYCAFTERDYCILSIPIQVSKSKPVLEMLKYFIRINPRPYCKLNDDLYVTHRSCIFGDISVHYVRPQDVPHIECLISQTLLPKHDIRSTDASIYLPQSLDNLHWKQREAEIVMRILYDVVHEEMSEYTFLTIRCGNSTNSIDDNIIVGFAILRAFTKLHYLNRHYYIGSNNEFLEIAHAEIITLKLHPLYHFEADLIFRNISLCTDFWDFYYLAPVKFSGEPLTNDLLVKMQPIEPRRVKKFEFCATDDKPEPHPRLSIYKEISLTHDTFALYQHNMRPTWMYGNTNTIVIIGFSEACKAFLRLLIFNAQSANLKNTNSYCCLPNLKIFIITPPGVVEAEYENELQCKYCMDQRDCWLNFCNYNQFIKDITFRMDLRVWVKFIGGCVNTIHRTNKYLLLCNNCEIYYDILLLMSDTKFGLPKAISDCKELPYNYAHINTRLDKIMVNHKVAVLVENEFMFNSNIIVYGMNIYTFEFIAFLLKHGIAASSINLVIPYEVEVKKRQIIFNCASEDEAIEQILLNMTEDLGVNVHERMNFVKWLTYNDNINITSVVFAPFPVGEEVEMQCDFFVSFEKINMSRELYEVLKAADIEMQERHIVVDEHYCTNDAHIYALGRYIVHKIEPNHQYTCTDPAEAASKLIHLLALNTERAATFDEKYSKPYYYQAQLPLDFHMVKIILPKRFIRNHLANEYLHAMTTYDGDFCRVRLNEHGIVEEITCVVKRKADFDFLQFFVGKHEMLLNNLRSRWIMGYISSFLKFLQEPWTELLMHDNYIELSAQTKELGRKLAAYIVQLPLERSQRINYMLRYMKDDGQTALVYKAFLELLRKHRRDFCHDFALPEDFPQYNIL